MAKKEKEIKPEKEKNLGGRPQIEIDERLLRELAKIHLPTRFIAKCLGVSHDTLQRRFASVIEEQQAQGKAKLLRKAWNKVDENDWQAIKFLLQNYLGLTDKVETKTESMNTTFLLNYSKEKLDKAINGEKE